MLDSVLTLIAGADTHLDPVQCEGVRQALRRLGADTEKVDWLAADRACDIPFGQLDPDQADAAARQFLDGQAIDVVAQAQAERRKRLLLADMESTMIHNEMLDELAAFIGKGEEVASITARAMNGELDFAGAIEARVALLKELPVETLTRAGEAITYTAGARTLVQTMRGHGAYTALVSGGFTFYTEGVAAHLGMDLHVANTLEIVDGRLSGRVGYPILGREAKCATLVKLASQLELPLIASLTVGDGANDLDMIQAAGLGIAFHGKPALLARAKYRIDHADLTALLYAQGYRLEEFA